MGLFGEIMYEYETLNNRDTAVISGGKKLIFIFCILSVIIHTNNDEVEKIMNSLFIVDD